jgi:hypothetical protein
MNDSEFDGKKLYELTTAQATELLHAFLTKEEAVFRELKIDGINLDHSRDSVVRLFEHVLAHQFDSNDANAPSNNVWFLRLAYYFGESLCRVSNHLRWAIGKVGTAEENHPVIAGFGDETEAALITIARNILVAVANESKGTSSGYESYSANCPRHCFSNEAGRRQKVRTC